MSDTSSDRTIAALAVLAVLLGGVAGVGSDAAANERGEQLFALCVNCHGADAAGDYTAGAPAIAGMPAWSVKTQLTKFRAGQRGRHFDDTFGMRMRPMALTLRTDDDVAAVAEYVASLPPTHPDPRLEGGDAEKGKTLYAPCVACHGMSGEGREQQFGSPLSNVSDWYLLRQLENFKAGVRGAPGDQYGAIMRAMSATLTDEQVMKDVIAHIMTLSK